MGVTGRKNKGPASLYISVLLPFPKICITCRGIFSLGQPRPRPLLTPRRSPSFLSVHLKPAQAVESLERMFHPLRAGRQSASPIDEIRNNEMT